MGSGAFDLAGQPLGAIGQLHLGLAQCEKIGHPGLEFDGVEGLVQEIGGAGLDGLDAHGLVVVRGDHDDRHDAVGRA
ncbi:hypothetical protein D3C71_2162680 [compost metagenome]